MELFDPARPRLGNFPKFLSEDSAINYFIFKLKPNNLVEISIMARDLADTLERSYHYKNIVLNILDVSKFLTDFSADPEKTMQDYFSWGKQKLPIINFLALKNTLK